MIGFNRIGRGILTHAIQIRCREQLVLLFYIASRKNIAKAVIKKKTLPDFPARTERSSLARVYKRRTTSNAIFERRPPTPLLDIPIPFSFISSYFTSAIIPRLVRTVANGVVRASNANQRVPIYFVSAPSSDTTTLKSWNRCRRSRSRQHRATRGSNEESVRPSNMYIMYTVLYSRIFSTIYKTRHC